MTWNEIKVKNENAETERWQKMREWVLENLKETKMKKELSLGFGPFSKSFLEQIEECGFSCKNKEELNSLYLFSDQALKMFWTAWKTRGCGLKILKTQRVVLLMLSLQNNGPK